MVVKKSKTGDDDLYWPTRRTGRATSRSRLSESEAEPDLPI